MMQAVSEAAGEVLPLRLILEPEGFCIELTRPEVVIGRHTDADVRLGFPDISRRHCRCVFDHGIWQITDLNSTNGVYINGERIQEAYLYDGDRIRIGSAEVTVSLVGQSSTVSMLTRSPESEVLASIADALPPAQRKAS